MYIGLVYQKKGKHTVWLLTKDIDKRRLPDTINHMAIIFLIGRILLGGFFLYNGINHFLKAGSLTHYAASKGVPAPGIAVFGTGLLLFFGGLGVILGVYPTIALSFTILFLIPTTFMMHAFWKEHDPEERVSQMIAFSKNMALLGASLMLLSYPLPWPYMF